MNPDEIRSWAAQYERALGESPTDRALASQRAKLLFAHATQQQKKKRFGVFLVPALATALALVGLWFFETRAEKSETVLAGNAPVLVGTTFESGPAAARLAFSGGSVADVSAKARVRLDESSASRVAWRILDGRMSFDVKRKAEREWVILAGAARVRVLGTAFTVDYSESEGSLAVFVERGRVEVTPEGASPFVLAKGESYRSPTKNPHPENDLPTSPPSEDTAPRSIEKSPNKAHSASPPRGPLWQELVRDGKYEAALEAVRASGVENVLARASAPDLLLLGNAARFRADVDLAERAYRATRKGGDAASKALAAYYLARIALDARKDRGEGIRWLRTHLAEAPRGELSATARGRLMDLLERNGDHSGARTIAAEYLALHADGPDAALAERLLRTNAPP